MFPALFSFSQASGWRVYLVPDQSGYPSIVLGTPAQVGGVVTLNGKQLLCLLFRSPLERSVKAGRFSNPRKLVYRAFHQNYSMTKQQQEKQTPPSNTEHYVDTQCAYYTPSCRTFGCHQCAVWRGRPLLSQPILLDNLESEDD